MVKHTDKNDAMKIFGRWLIFFNCHLWSHVERWNLRILLAWYPYNRTCKYHRLFVAMTDESHLNRVSVSAAKEKTLRRLVIGDSACIPKESSYSASAVDAGQFDDVKSKTNFSSLSWKWMTILFVSARRILHLIRRSFIFAVSSLVENSTNVNTFVPHSDIPNIFSVTKTWFTDFSSHIRIRCT